MSEDVVLAFTDGACLGNPGPGGYAALLRMGSREREVVGGEPMTTNNRMELMAAIAALEALKRPVKVTLTSDSQYVLKGMKEWIKGWKARGWRTKDKKDVANRDLWERLDRAAAPHQVEWLWVKGHAGHVENERVDQLANSAAERFRHGGGEAADPAGDLLAAPISTAAEIASAVTIAPTEAIAPTETMAVGAAPAAGRTLPTRVEGALHVGCRLLEAVDAPAWCELGAGNTGVHCLTGSGEALCPHAVPSLVLQRLEVADPRGKAAAFDLAAGSRGRESERAASLLKALGAAADPGASPGKKLRKPRKR